MGDKAFGVCSGECVVEFSRRRVKKVAMEALDAGAGEQ